MFKLICCFRFVYKHWRVTNHPWSIFFKSVHGTIKEYRFIFDIEHFNDSPMYIDANMISMIQTGNKPCETYKHKRFTWCYSDRIHNFITCCFSLQGIFNKLQWLCCSPLNVYSMVWLRRCLHRHDFEWMCKSLLKPFSALFINRYEVQIGFRAIQVLLQ